VRSIPRYRVGLPLVYLSPIIMCARRLRTGGAMLAAGLSLQLLGHRVEGSRPVFLSDPRAIVLSILWWFEEMGCPLHVDGEGRSNR
jgi:hypothetical protein